MTGMQTRGCHGRFRALALQALDLNLLCKCATRYVATLWRELKYMSGLSGQVGVNHVFLHSGTLGCLFLSGYSSVFELLATETVLSDGLRVLADSVFVNRAWHLSMMCVSAYEQYENEQRKSLVKTTASYKQPRV